MVRYFLGTRSELLTLETASKWDLTWDVFVSHTTEDDDDDAEEVVKCIRSFGPSAWVDSDHLDSKHDGPSMASIIQGGDQTVILLTGCRDECNQRVMVGAV